jgi:hypothetical protein
LRATFLVARVRPRLGPSDNDSSTMRVPIE